MLALAIRVNNLDELSNLITYINGQNLLPQYVYILVKAELADQGYSNLLAYSANLCMQSKIISMETDVNLEITNTVKVDYIVYLEDNMLLVKPNLLKKCKKNIIANKKMDKIRLIAGGL